MKQSLIKLLTLTLALLACGSAWAEPLRVGMFIDATSVDGIASPQEKAAAQWFKTAYVDAGKGAFITKTTDASTLTTANYSTIWVNIDREGYIQDALTDYLNTNLEAFKSYFNAGGSFYLSKMASDMVVLLGRTSIKPNQMGSTKADNYDSANEWWGINPYINYSAIATNGWYRDNTSHPIFAGLASQSYNGAEFEIYPLIGCAEGGSFQRYDHNWCWNLASVGGLQGDGANNAIKFEETCVAKVLGTWNHVTGIEAATVVEFYPINGQGRIIVNGASAYQWNVANAYTDNMTKLTDNTIKYLVDNNRQNIYLGMWIDAADVAEIASSQEKNAAEWFMETIVSTGHGEFITTNTPASVINTTNYKTIWVNINRSGFVKNSELPASLTGKQSAYNEYFGAKGNFFLTTYGTCFATKLGRITATPDEWGNGSKTNSDVWGINPDFTDSKAGSGETLHPIYKGLTTYNWVSPGVNTTIFPFVSTGSNASDNNCFWKYDQFKDCVNYQFLGTWNHEKSNGFPAVVQFDGSKVEGSAAQDCGCILACGASAYQWTDGNVEEYQTNVEIFTLNSLNYLAGYYWDPVSGGVSGAEDVEVAPAEEGPARFFNLQGIEVDGSNLIPGIYIRIQGNKTTKFLVK